MKKLRSTGEAEVVFTSEAERERRYSALRDRMERAGLDALVIYGRGDERVRGRVFYVSDIWQAHGEAFVVLPFGGEPVFVNDRLAGLDEAEMTTWITDLRTQEGPGFGVGEVLRSLDLEESAIGIVGLADRLPVAYLEQMRAMIPGAHLGDATELFEEVRQVKSSEELGNLRETSVLLKRCFAAVEAELRPGITERHLMAQAVRLARELGCLETLAYLATTPFHSFTWGTERTFEPGQTVIVWLECAGPSGYWLELNRCFSIGPPPREAIRIWELQLKAFEAVLKALKPGVPANTVVDVTESVYSDHGHASGGVYVMHGIGTDSNEGMWVPGNDRDLKEGEVVSVHPYVEIADPREAAAAKYIVVTDNVLVTSARGEQLTYAIPKWIEI